MHMYIWLGPGDPSLRPKIDIANNAVFFRISKHFRNLYVVCFILATVQIFSLERGGHKCTYYSQYAYAKIP